MLLLLTPVLSGADAPTPCLIPASRRQEIRVLQEIFPEDLRQSIPLQESASSANSVRQLTAAHAAAAILLRPLLEPELTALQQAGCQPAARAFAYEHWAFVVHRDNPVDALTQEQLDSIYRRQIVTWREIGGHDDHITLYSRDPASRTYEILMHRFTNPQRRDISSRITFLGSCCPGEDAIQRDPTGLILSGYEPPLPAPLKALAIDGVAYTRQTLENGTYPLRTPILLVLRNEPEEGSALFRLRTFLESPPAQRLLQNRLHLTPAFPPHPCNAGSGNAAEEKKTAVADEKNR